jgi:hypothetical protein
VGKLRASEKIVIVRISSGQDPGQNPWHKGLWMRKIYRAQAPDGPDDFTLYHSQNTRALWTK